MARNFERRVLQCGFLEHFRAPERRKEFFKEYKEIEMLYEIISPDKFLRPFIENYTTLSAIYDVVRNAYTRQVMVVRAFQRKTSELVQKHIHTYEIEEPSAPVLINEDTVDYIANKDRGDATKVINLVKGIQKIADDHSDDPYLVAMAERAQAVQESFEHRQSTTAETLAELQLELERNELRKKEQAERGFDDLSYFFFSSLSDAGLADPQAATEKIRKAFSEFSNWQQSEKSARELRRKITFAIIADGKDIEDAPGIVDGIMKILEKSKPSS